MRTQEDEEDDDNEQQQEEEEPTELDADAEALSLSSSSSSTAMDAEEEQMALQMRVQKERKLAKLRMSWRRSEKINAKNKQRISTLERKLAKARVDMQEQADVHVDELRQTQHLFHEAEHRATERNSELDALRAAHAAEVAEHWAASS